MPVAIFAVLVSAVAGGLFGSTALAKQDQVQQQYRVFTSALAAIDREYVEEVPSDRLVYGAIDGMLKTLDPHSSFLIRSSTRNCESARKAGITASGFPFRSSMATSPSCPSSRARPRIDRGFAAAT